MPCDHIGAPEVIEMAERQLAESGIAREAWPGRRFRYSENLSGGMWASIVIEVERRGEEWIVTRLDRNRETLPISGSEFRSL